MTDRLSLDEVRATGARAYGDRDPEALDTLVELSRSDHRPEVRGTAAVFLGAIDWDDRTLPALTRLLADPARVSLAGHPGFTDALNDLAMYDGHVIGPGMATATLATQNAGDLSAPIEKIARVALGQRTKGWTADWHDVADPEALLDLITVGDVPVDPDVTDPAQRHKQEFAWRDKAASLLLQLDDHVRPEHVPALVDLAMQGSTAAEIMLKERDQLLTVNAVTRHIGDDAVSARLLTAKLLAKMAKRADESARLYLRQLSADGEKSVAKQAAKGLKLLDKAQKRR